MPALQWHKMNPLYFQIAEYINEMMGAGWDSDGVLLVSTFIQEKFEEGVKQ